MRSVRSAAANARSLGDRGVLGRTDQALVADGSPVVSEMGQRPGGAPSARIVLMTSSGPRWSDRRSRCRADPGRRQRVGPAVALAPIEGGVRVAVEQAALVARRRERRDADGQRERLDGWDGSPPLRAPARDVGDGQAAVDIGTRERIANSSPPTRNARSFRWRDVWMISPTATRSRSPLA